MIEFVLFSRKGRTDGNFRNLREAGRLDVVYQCLLLGFFTSGAIRRDVIFHVILGGPPRPPVHLVFDGRHLTDIRTDERTWEDLFRKILSGGSHPGVELKRESFQELVKELAGTERRIFILEEKGEGISEVEFGNNPAFVLGDHVGLPRKDESFALRYGTKISLGRRAYLAATCVDVINYLLDSRATRE